MEHFLLTWPRQPRIWLRGKYGCWLRERGITQWNTRVQSYNQWNRSSVRAFIRPDEPLGLQLETQLQGPERQVRLRKIQFAETEVKEFDACFVSDQFVEHHPDLADAHGVYHWPYEGQGLSEWLGWIDQTCAGSGLEHVVTLPYGYEDESILLHEWVDAPGLPRVIEYPLPRRLGLRRFERLGTIIVAGNCHSDRFASFLVFRSIQYRQSSHSKKNTVVMYHRYSNPAMIRQPKSAPTANVKRSTDSAPERKRVGSSCSGGSAIACSHKITNRLPVSTKAHTKTIRQTNFEMSIYFRRLGNFSALVSSPFGFRFFCGAVMPVASRKGDGAFLIALPPVLVFGCGIV